MRKYIVEARDTLGNTIKQLEVWADSETDALAKGQSIAAYMHNIHSAHFAVCLPDSLETKG